MEKEYTVLYSGHGSCYDFDGATPDSEKFTKAEAEALVDGWERTADTVGGRAIIFHLPSWNGDYTQFHHCKGNRCQRAQELKLFETA